MAQLKDSLITGDLRVTGTIYGDVPLNDLVNADDLKAIEALSGTSGILKKTAANTWTLDTNAYTTSSGVTSVATGTGLTGGTITSTGTISLANNYGDTKNPYASKTARYVLAAPANAAGAPSFRALTNADVGLGNVENTKLSTWAGSSNITTIGTLSSGTVPWARLSNVPSASTSAAGIIQIGTGASNAAAGNHTHTTSLASDTGTSTVTLTSGGKFKLTAGGTSVIFTMPTSTNNAGTITGVTGSDGLTGSGTSGSVTIKHAAPSTSPAKTTSAVYPITIDKYGHITAAGSAVTIPAAVSVKGNAETTYRTGQVNLTPANIGAAAASHTHPIKTITGTMPTSTSSPWTINTTNKTVQISDAKITAKSVLQWGLASTATQAQYEAFAEAQFIDSTTAAGSATIKALGTMPTVAIPVVIHILGETE